jgi:hypothetical protein
MDTWLHAIHVDKNHLFRWYVLNRHGEEIIVSVKTFYTEKDARADLREFLNLMGR